MTADKSFLTSRKGIDNALSTSGMYENTYGISLQGVFKPFTTKIDVLGVPHYHQPDIITTYTGGQFGATSSGLNPFGPTTVFEGIIYGSGLGGDLQATVPDPEYVRSFGLKNPIQIVGWGYDIFGYPTPNSSSGWNASGSLGTFVPSGTFMGTGLMPATHGRIVPVNFYAAGPLDMRWDQHRGVWCGWDGGVRIGRVYSVHINQTGNYIAGSSYFPDEVTYSVELFDGVANQMRMTGMTPYGPRPIDNTYKILPLSSGSPCFIINVVRGNGAPGFGIWMSEPPGVEACENIAGEQSFNYYGGAGDGDPSESTGILSGESLFDGLATFPIRTEFGGIGLTTVPNNYILAGDVSGNIEARELISGSGVDVIPSGSSFIVSIGSGVAFIEAGINNNITELQGLTTPLSIAQGGTGASTKNFIDLTTNQSVSSGLKTFQKIRIAGGSLENPGLSLREDQEAGLFYDTGNFSLGIVVSGAMSQLFNITGIHLTNEVLIHRPNDVGATTSGTYGPPLTLRRSSIVGPGGELHKLISLQDNLGVEIGYTDGSGIAFGPTGSRMTIIKPDTSSDFTLILPTGSTSTLNLATKQYVDNAAPQATGYTGSLELLDGNGTTVHTLTISNGKIMSVSSI